MALKPKRQSTVSICRVRKAYKATTTNPSTAETTTTGAAPFKSRIQDWSTLVQNPKIRQALPLIGNGAYVLLASGFLMTDMLSLRVALVGGYTGLVSFHALHPRPLQIPLRWSAVFVLVNAGAACMLAMDQFGAPLSDEEKELHTNHFSQLTSGQFYQLLTLGKKQEAPDGTILTREGRVCPRLYFIEKGTAKVFHHGAFAAKVDEGGFVNDVAFQIGEEEGAYGTVVTEGECSIIVWDQEELREHLKSRSDMDRNTKYLLSQHLMKSLLKQREARRWNQTLQQRRSHNEQLQVEEKQMQYT